MKLLFRVILSLFLISSIANAATLLPNGEQTFFDANGNPLANGTVNFFIPNTTTNKNTWKDTNQTILNTNPIRLDAGGRAIIYGTGAYRQVVKDTNGNIIWDQLTADTSGTTASFGGTSTGTANAQIVNAPNFSSNDGQSVSFIAGFTNTSATALVVNGISINILKDTLIGPVGLTGNEIVIHNQYAAIYDASIGQFHLMAYPNVQGIGGAINLTSNATTDIGTISTHNINITGTTTITSFGSSANIASPFYFVQFASPLVITASSNISIPTGTSLLTTAGSSIFLNYLGSGVWRILYYSNGGVPSNNIAMFYLTACPLGWTAADGTNNTPDMRGYFARALDTGGSIDPGRTLGSFQADAVGPHTHDAPGGTHFLDDGGPGKVNLGGSALDIDNSAGTTGPVTGGATETRPKNIALLACMKQ